MVVPAVPEIVAEQEETVLEKSDSGRERGMSYSEIAPPPRLTDWIASLWQTSIPDLGAAQVRIMPNACVDLVFYVSDPSWGEGPAAVVAPPHRSYVVGSTLRSFMVRSVGWRHIVGASLLPAGVEPLLGLPARVIGESVAFLRDVIGKRADEWENRVIDGPTDGALGRLTRALEEVRPNREANSVVVEAVRLVRDAQGRKRIDDLAAMANVSTRRLERHFIEHVGIPAKTFSRLVRFDRAVRDIGARGKSSWSQFALAHGYNDQAHFINEFKEFAGLTPAQFETESRL